MKQIDKALEEEADALMRIAQTGDDFDQRCKAFDRKLAVEKLKLRIDDDDAPGSAFAALRNNDKTARPQ
jgi:hypothetical protein